MHAKPIFLLLCVLGLAAGRALAQDDDYDLPMKADPSCFGDKVRISALISSGGKVKVGLVLPETKASYLVAAGQKAGGIEVVSADYERELVVLRMGDQVCSLSLSSDPNAPVPEVAKNNLQPFPNDGIYRGEAIEQFLRENPNALENGMVKFPMPVDLTPAKGKGEGIEAFLRENPELAAELDKPVEGKGEGIEAFLREHPEIKVIDEPVTEGFGPGIEEQLRLHPELWTNALPGIPDGQLPPPVTP